MVNSAADSKKYVPLVLVCLVAQNAGLVLLTKYSFRATSTAYNQGAVILFAELLKLLACTGVEFISSNYSAVGVAKSLKWSHSNLFMLLPASLYVVQNVLQLSAIHGLSPVVFITGAQLKIPTSAFFSFVILGRRLSKRQLLSIPLLTFGVAVVQLEQGNRIHDLSVDLNRSVGPFISLLVAVTISGLAGAMLERAFKSSDGTVWIKNIFLSLFSLPSAVYYAFRAGVHSESLYSHSILNGFDEIVVAIVLLLAFGGLISALVMKYAGTLTKCYAVSLSIVICTTVSVLKGMQILDVTVLTGMTMVMAAVFMYAS